MTRKDKLREKVLHGKKAAVKFDELTRLLLQCGFDMDTSKAGSSHIYFSREDLPDVLNLQPSKDGSAKPYQVAQVRNLFKQYRL